MGYADDVVFAYVSIGWYEPLLMIRTGWNQYSALICLRQHTLRVRRQAGGR
jgi:hypothetical protein